MQKGTHTMCVDYALAKSGHETRFTVCTTNPDMQVIYGPKSFIDWILTQVDGSTRESVTTDVFMGDPAKRFIMGTNADLVEHIFELIGREHIKPLPLTRTPILVIGLGYPGLGGSPVII